VLREFADPTVPHVFGGVDPRRDAARISDELLLADLGIVEKRLGSLQKDLSRPIPASEREMLLEEQALLESCRQAIEQQRGIGSVEMSSAQEKMLRSYAFLTLKGAVWALNVGEDQVAGSPDLAGLSSLEPPPVPICARLEMEMMELDEEERVPFMEDAGLAELATSRLVRRCCEALAVRTFFTYAHDEVGAWMVQAGEDAVAAAGKIHTDMARGFIRAEVVGFDELVACGSLKDAKAHGKVRLEGKDYEVQDGDVMTFRFGRS